MTENQKNQIIRMRSNGDGYRVISDKLGLSLNTVKSFCRRNNLGGVAKPERKKIEYSDEVAYCQNCGAEIRQIAKQKKKRFCCDKCRNAWWNSHLDLVKRKAMHKQTCPGCGKEFDVYGRTPRKYCSHACYVADRFGGGRNDQAGF